MNNETIAAARLAAAHLFALGGPDLRHLSDDELMDRIITAGKNMAATIPKAGITAAEAAAAFQRLRSALNNHGIPVANER